MEHEQTDPAVDLIDYYTPLVVRMFVAAGIFEAFGRERRTLSDVATATRVDQATLARMVRAMASRGMFQENDDGWELTALGRRFLHDEPGSVSGLANFKPWELHAWSEAIHTLRTGEPSFPEYFTLGFWEWLAAHPEQSQLFNEDMRRRTTTLLDGGLALYEWPDEGLVVDVGGGNGLMLERILRERPGLRGVVLDQPHVVDEARQHFDVEGVSDRAEAVGGDFFFEVPAGRRRVPDGERPARLARRGRAPHPGDGPPRDERRRRGWCSSRRSSCRAARWTWAGCSTCTCWCCSAPRNARTRIGNRCWPAAASRSSA